MAGKTILTEEQKMVQRLNAVQMQLSPLIEMNGAEFEERVRQEMDDNPALEVAEAPEESLNDTTEDGDRFEETAEQVQDADYGSDDDIPYYRTRANNSSADDEYRGPQAVSEQTLAEYLLEQIHEQEMTEKQYLIAEYIVGNIDDRGYLDRTVSQIADDITFNDGKETEPYEVAQVLAMVQRLDPAGIAAQDARDCLRIQLEQLPEGDDRNLALDIVLNHFDEFKNKKVNELCRAMDITMEQYQAAEDCLRHLNLHPSSAFATGTEIKSDEITPDFEVDVDDTDGSISITLLNRIPELQISESYSSMYEQFEKVKPRTKREQEQAMIIRKSYDDAGNFLRLVKMRQETLFATMRSIVKHQREFFLSGDESDLNPLTLKQVSADTGYDESVLSRATTNKYVWTRRGVYSLKFFFHGKMKQGDDDVTPLELQNVIKELVDAEDKTRPLSDEQITIKLTSRGYSIKRRTVAKYRELLKIPVARMRRTVTSK